MGLLDDAIREHLDLKRRHGADPAEIERAEQEALGPVRRGPEVSGEEVAPDEAVFEDQMGHLAGEDLDFLPAAPAPEPWQPFHEDAELYRPEEQDDLPPYEPAHGPSGDPLMEDERYPPAGAHPAPHPAERSPGSESDPGAASFRAEPSSEPPRSHLEQETQEYEVEHEQAENDDMLETTPEFLQDAPDHDRLWFEQRPPRDFDFDG